MLAQVLCLACFTTRRGGAAGFTNTFALRCLSVPEGLQENGAQLCLAECDEYGRGSPDGGSGIVRLVRLCCAAAGPLSVPATTCRVATIASAAAAATAGRPRAGRGLNTNCSQGLMCIVCYPEVEVNLPTCQEARQNNGSSVKHRACCTCLRMQTGRKQHHPEDHVQAKRNYSPDPFLPYIYIICTIHIFVYVYDNTRDLSKRKMADNWRRACVCLKLVHYLNCFWGAKLAKGYSL